MAYNWRVKKVMEARERRPTQQFGQTDDESTRNGALGCTQTVLQFLAWLWKNHWYTHDQISRLAGYPGYPAVNRGLRPVEVLRFCQAVGLNYSLRTDLTGAELLQLSNRRGPIGFGHSYSWWPEWMGYNYFGTKADGKPNGYALPARAAGKTQLRGFEPPRDAHFGLLLGYDPSQDPSRARVVAWEPNHGSIARPEKPAYDRMTSNQFINVYDSYHKVLGRQPYALIPREALRP